MSLISTKKNTKHILYELLLYTARLAVLPLDFLYTLIKDRYGWIWIITTIEKLTGRLKRIHLIPNISVRQDQSSSGATLKLSKCR